MPDSVEVVGQRFSLRLVDADDPEIDQRAGRARLGRQEIVISRAQGPDQLRDSVLHEVFHAVAWLSGVDDQKLDEHNVRVLTPVLLDAIRRNPELVAFLTEGAA